MKEAVIKIAYADHHHALREGLVAILNQQANIRVVAHAPNGKQLLSSIEQSKVLPDIAILDIDMPEMNGYETARQIRKNFPAVKSIAFTIYKDEFNIIKMIRNGAVGYLTKGNSSLSDLFQAVQEVHTKGHYYSGSIGEKIFEKAKHTNVPEITEREREFLHHCCEGLSNKQMAEKMNVSYRSVEHYYDSLSKKLGIRSRIGIVAFVLKTGIISHDSLSL